MNFFSILQICNEIFYNTYSLRSGTVAAKMKNIATILYSAYCKSKRIIEDPENLKTSSRNLMEALSDEHKNLFYDYEDATLTLMDTQCIDVISFILELIDDYNQVL